MVLLFPGQGSQQPGMGKFLIENFKVAELCFEEASDSLSLDFKKLCLEGSEAELGLTENTQPALLLVSTATHRVLQTLGDLKTQTAAGHSIGEYAALVSAGVLSLPEALRAVRIRGQAMQSAVPVGQGGMLAVMGLEPEQVQKMCDWAVKESRTGPLSPANYNSPGQIVISGSLKTIQWLRDNFAPEKVFGTEAPKRAKLIPLQVSAPFHCEMMKPAEDQMREVLSALNFQKPKFQILQNFTAQMVQDPEILRENLIRQVSAPVLWMQSMGLLLEQNLHTCIECGHGSVLRGLLKKIDSERFKVFNTSNLEEMRLVETFLKQGS